MLALSILRKVGEVIPASCGAPRRVIQSDKEYLSISDAEAILGGRFESIELATGELMLIRLAPRDVSLPINGRATVLAQGTILATEWIAGDTIVLSQSI